MLSQITNTKITLKYLKKNKHSKIKYKSILNISKKSNLYFNYLSIFFPQKFLPNFFIDFIKYQPYFQLYLSIYINTKFSFTQILSSI